MKSNFYQPEIDLYQKRIQMVDDELAKLARVQTNPEVPRQLKEFLCRYYNILIDHRRAFQNNLDQITWKQNHESPEIYQRCLEIKDEATRLFPGPS